MKARSVPAVLGLGRGNSKLTPRVYTRRERRGDFRGAPAYSPVPPYLQQTSGNRETKSQHLTLVIRELPQQADRRPVVHRDSTLGGCLCELSDF
jgi:hypothetical protein